MKIKEWVALNTQPKGSDRGTSSFKDPADENADYQGNVENKQMYLMDS